MVFSGIIIKMIVFLLDNFLFIKKIHYLSEKAALVTVEKVAGVVRASPDVTLKALRKGKSVVPSLGQDSYAR